MGEGAGVSGPLTAWSSSASLPGAKAMVGGAERAWLVRLGLWAAEDGGQGRSSGVVGKGQLGEERMAQYRDTPAKGSSGRRRSSIKMQLAQVLSQNT